MADGQDALPDFVEVTVGIGVRVGCFLHLGVIPDIGVRVVRPGDHVGKEMILLRRAAERAVDDFHRFGAGDEAVGLEGAVAVSADEAKLGGCVDEGGCPMLIGVGEDAGAARRGGAVEGHGDLHQLGACDRVAGTEGVVLVSVQDTGIG